MRAGHGKGGEYSLPESATEQPAPGHRCSRRGAGLAPRGGATCRQVWLQKGLLFQSERPAFLKNT